MDEMMGKTVTGALTPEAAVTTLNTYVDEALKDVGK